MMVEKITIGVVVEGAGHGGRRRGTLIGRPEGHGILCCSSHMFLTRLCGSPAQNIGTIKMFEVQDEHSPNTSTSQHSSTNTPPRTLEQQPK